MGVLMDAFAKRQQLKPALHLLEVMVEDLGIKRPKEKWVKWLRIMMERKGLSHPLVPPVRDLALSVVSSFCFNKESSSMHVLCGTI